MLLMLFACACVWTGDGEVETEKETGKGRKEERGGDTGDGTAVPVVKNFISDIKLQ